MNLLETRVRQCRNSQKSGLCLFSVEVDGMKESTNDVAVSVRNLEKVQFLKNRRYGDFIGHIEWRADFSEFLEHNFSKRAQENAEVHGTRVYSDVLYTLMGRKRARRAERERQYLPSRFLR